LKLLPTGRYQIHELLRQYAAEHLARSPEDMAQVYDLHCAYYADWPEPALLRSDPESAQTYIQQAYATVQTTGDRWFRAYCLIEMGDIAAALQNYAAEEHYQAAYALRQKFNDPEGMAVALNHLGEAAFQQKDFAGVRQLSDLWQIGRSQPG